MKIYLVERYSPDIKFDKDSIVVALTPQVCYQLDKAGIKHSIIEDYYDEAELCTHEDENFKSQLWWTDRLDEFLQKNIKELKELNLKLGTMYYFNLKTVVLDPLYVRCYTLKRLFEATKPSSAILVSLYPPEDISLDRTLRDEGKSYYSQIIPILCAQNNVPLTSVFLHQDKVKIKPISHENPVPRLRRTLGKIEIVRTAYFMTYFRIQFIYKYLRRQPLPKQPNEKKLNIFMLRPQHIGVDFVIDALRNSHRVYQLLGNSIIKYTPLGMRKHLNINAEYQDKAKGLSSSIWENTANLLEGNDLIKWINEKCQLDVSKIVLPKLEHFVSKLCPQIVGYFKVFTEFYEKEQIDILITPHVSPLIEYAALAAANYHEHVMTACLRHGDVVYDSKALNIVELRNFNIHISSNTEAKEYYECLGKAINSPAKLYSSPHRLLDLKRIKCLREKGKGIRKNRIIYLPTFLRGNYGRFDCVHYPDTWYYEFQKSLIEYFSTRREYNFVWKGWPISDRSYNPIPNFIMDNNFSNIEIATNPFVQHLLSADRVICDYPSTGFYESVVAGIPTMSLYHKAFKVRKSAVDYLGNLLKLYCDIREAINHIDEFLNSDPELYRTTIDMEDNSILDILEEIVEGKTSE